MQAKKKLITAILIDPFQEALHLVGLPRDTKAQLREMYKLMDCETVQAVPLSIPKHPRHFLWCDESGLLRTPWVYPNFVCTAYSDQYPIAGYGLVTGMSDAGSIADSSISLPDLGKLIHFEPWKNRIATDSVIDQLLRIYPPIA